MVYTGCQEILYTFRVWVSSFSGCAMHLRRSPVRRPEQVHRWRCGASPPAPVLCHAGDRFRECTVPIADQQLSIEAFYAHPSSAQRFTDEPLPSGFGDRAVHIYAPHVAPAGIFPLRRPLPIDARARLVAFSRRHPKLGCRFCVKEKAGLLVGSVGADAHAVKGAVHERKGNDEEDGRHDVRQGAALRSG